MNVQRLEWDEINPDLRDGILKDWVAAGRDPVLVKTYHWSYDAVGKRWLAFSPYPVWEQA